MKRSIRTIVAATALAVPLAVLAQAPVKIYSIVELSGGGATAGTNFDNGLKLAFKEINAAGGILNRKIDVISVDTQSNPGIAKALTQKAVDDSAYVVMGPVFSGSIMVSMAETKKAEIPNFTGGEAGVHHAARQSVRVPHVVHAIDGDAQGREVPARQREGEDGRDHVGQQRLRQGRARLDGQGPRSRWA
jgi:hypothetical protein